MKRCNYCYTDNVETKIKCVFCEAPLNIERKVLRNLQQIDEIEIFYLNYPTLKKLNHIELLRLLRHAREQQKFFDSDDNPEDAFRYRRVLQKKIYLLENLIFDQMGRVPKTTDFEISRINNIRKKQIFLHKKLMTHVIKLPHHTFFENRFL